MRIDEQLMEVNENKWKWLKIDQKLMKIDEKTMEQDLKHDENH